MAWGASEKLATYADRGETRAMIGEALISPANPYAHDAPAVRRILGRYDEDQQKNADALKKITELQTDIMLELRVQREVDTRLKKKDRSR
jgi:hypothetical protein